MNVIAVENFAIKGYHWRVVIKYDDGYIVTALKSKGKKHIYSEYKFQEDSEGATECANNLIKQIKSGEI